MRIRDVVKKTCRRRWTIGKSSERGSGISVLPARHDDDDDDIVTYWPLTEPSCSGCVNRKTVMRASKQLTWVDSQKRVTWVENRKRVGIVKSHMKAPTAVTVSHAVTQIQSYESSQQLPWVGQSEKQKCQVGSWIWHNVAKKLWVNIAVLRIYRQYVLAFFVSLSHSLFLSLKVNFRPSWEIKLWGLYLYKEVSCLFISLEWSVILHNATI